MLISLTEFVSDNYGANFRTREAFKLVEEKGQFGVWSWDLKSKKMLWSEGFFRLLGLEPGSVEPSFDALELVSHPDDLHSPDELERLFSEGGAIERKFRIIQKDGRIRWVVNRGEFYTEMGGPAYKAMGVLADVTNLHSSQSIASALQNRYARVIESMSAAVWILNGEGQPIDIRAWCSLTGQKVEDLANSGWLAAVHIADREEARKVRDFARANRSPYEWEFRLRVSDGTYRWFRTRAVPTFKADGSVFEWIGISTDIHDFKIWSSMHGLHTITGAQIRAARGLLNWSVNTLATASGISTSQIRRFEESDGVSKGSDDVLSTLRSCLEAAGLEFHFPIQGNALVRHV